MISTLNLRPDNADIITIFESKTKKCYNTKKERESQVNFSAFPLTWKVVKRRKWMKYFVSYRIVVKNFFKHEMRLPVGQQECFYKRSIKERIYHGRISLSFHIVKHINDYENKSVDKISSIKNRKISLIIFI